MLINSYAIAANTKVLVLDNLDEPGKTTQGQSWSFFTDGVMGGISKGYVELKQIDKIPCYRMIGNVTTENNGGFIQIRSILNPPIKINNYEGIYLKVFGNNKKYFLHLRTPFTMAPWQYYSFSFQVSNEWVEIKAPFVKFKKSNFYQPEKLLNQNITSIGLVAGFANYQADICLAEIGFY